METRTKHDVIIICEKCEHVDITSKFGVNMLSSVQMVNLVCPCCEHQNKVSRSSFKELTEKARKKRRERWNDHFIREYGIASKFSVISEIKKALGSYKRLTGTPVLRDVLMNGQIYIGLYIRGALIWHESRGYEYGKRYRQIADTLFEAFGSDVRDLVPDLYGFELYGDDLGSIELVKTTREELTLSYLAANSDYKFVKK